MTDKEKVLVGWIIVLGVLATMLAIVSVYAGIFYFGWVYLGAGELFSSFLPSKAVYASYANIWLSILFFKVLQGFLFPKRNSN